MDPMLEKFLESESKLLKAEIGKSVSEWPEPYPQLTASLIEKARFRSNYPATEGWSRQFDPLTLLYPILHADLLVGEPLETIRPWNVVHGLYLIHSILDDRILDGQISKDAQLLLYNRLVLIHAERMLQTMSPPCASWWRQLHHDYVVFQGWKSENETLPHGDWSGAMAELEEGAYGRAALGFLATSGMLSAAGCPDHFIQRVLEAYKPLVVALQWCDDFEDWRQDLSAGIPNLMLARLQFCQGLENADVRNTAPMQVERVLVVSASYSYALGRAQALLSESASRYAAMGASMLVQLIRRKTQRVAFREREHADALTRQIVAGFTRYFFPMGQATDRPLPTSPTAMEAVS